jgi:hypothetical protein
MTEGKKAEINILYFILLSPFSRFSALGKDSNIFLCVLLKHSIFYKILLYDRHLYRSQEIETNEKFSVDFLIHKQDLQEIRNYFVGLS